MYASVNKVLRLIDKDLNNVCVAPEYFGIDLSANDPKNATTYDITYLARNQICSDLTVFRTRVSRYLAEAYAIESRDTYNATRKDEATIEMFEILDANYKLINSLDIWMIRAPLSVSDSMGLPVLVQSYLRHHQQQYDYLYDLAMNNCSASMSAQHGSCAAAAEKFQRLSQNYLEVVSASKYLNYQMNDQTDCVSADCVSNIGLRNGSTTTE